MLRQQRPVYIFAGSSSLILFSCERCDDGIPGTAGPGLLPRPDSGQAIDGGGKENSAWWFQRY